MRIIMFYQNDYFIVKTKFMDFKVINDASY